MEVTFLQSSGTSLIVAASLIGLTACAEWTSCERFPGRCPGPIKWVGSAPKTSGTSGPIAWRWIDAQTSIDRSQYSATLIVTETAGRSITFTGIQRQAWTSTQGTTETSSGAWRLLPNGELRLPMAVRVTCLSAACLPTIPPYWEIVLTGKDDAGADVRVEIDVTLPVR